MPHWGRLRNITFNYRLTIGAVEQGRQVVHLYLAPQLSKQHRKSIENKLHDFKPVVGEHIPVPLAVAGNVTSLEALAGLP